jgi:hypothetical protein
MSRKMTTNEQQYLIDYCKSRYDELYSEQRNSGANDWADAEAEKKMLKSIIEKLLGHSVKRAGYNYI